MEFKIRQWIYFFVPVLIMFGIVIFIWTMTGWADKNSTQKQSVYLVAPIIFLIFFVLPIFTIRYLKIISRTGGTWTFRFPYMNTSISFDNKSVEKIYITENIGGLRVPPHEVITIETSSRKLHVSSLETKNYKKLRELFLFDFKGKIEIRNHDFLTVKTTLK